MSLVGLQSIMGWTALSGPAQDAADQQDSGRRKRPDLPQLRPAQWLAAAAVATGVLWAFSKLVLRRGPARVRNSKAESLPTHVLVNSKGGPSAIFMSPSKY